MDGWMTDRQMNRGTLKYRNRSQIHFYTDIKHMAQIGSGAKLID